MTGPAYLTAERLTVRLAGRPVVENVGFALARKSLTALVGPNGAGKTSLLRAVAGLIPRDGAVQVGGLDLAALPVRQRACTFAYLPQGHTVHWPLPVRDIVALGRYPHGATDPSRLPARDAAIVEQAMLAADVAALADRRVTELSGGERSRVLLARVLAVGAPAILADEPIASLDPRHQIDVMGVLRQAADAGALVIVVTHDLGLAARFADHVLVLQSGRLAAAGPPAVALAAPVLAQVFRVEAFHARHDGQAVIVPWRGV